MCCATGGRSWWCASCCAGAPASPNCVEACRRAHPRDLELPGNTRKRYWFVVDAGVVDLCDVDPRHEVDVVIVAHLRTLTKIWMGDCTYDQALREGHVVGSGPRALLRRMPAWLGQHPVLAPVRSAR